MKAKRFLLVMAQEQCGRTTQEKFVVYGKFEDAQSDMSGCVSNMLELFGNAVKRNYSYRDGYRIELESGDMLRGSIVEVEESEGPNGNYSMWV